MTYQKALDRVRVLKTQMYIDFMYRSATKGSMILLESEIDENLNIIQELVNEKLEQESRKEKLIVGSEWECLAKSLAPISARYIDTILDKHTIAIQKSWVLTVLEIEKDYVKLQYENTKCFLSQDQFLLCFKPIEKEESE